MVVKHVNTDAEYAQVFGSSVGKVMIVDFFATWCGPCRTIAPLFEQLSMRYLEVIFVKVDVDKCSATAASEGVSAMPTFFFYSDKQKVDQMRGANPQELEQKVRKWAESAAGSAHREPCPVPGQMNLMSSLDKSKCECLNEDNKSTLKNLLENSGILKSDADEQLIINITFQQAMKVHSMRFKAPKTNGPKTVKLFINHPHTIDFDSAEKSEAVQQLDLNETDLETGKVQELRFVRFQNLFIVDNQSGTDVTQLDSLDLYGTPVGSTTNMNDFKRVQGKAGESDH